MIMGKVENCKFCNAWSQFIVFKEGFFNKDSYFKTDLLDCGFCNGGLVQIEKNTYEKIEEYRNNILKIYGKEAYIKCFNLNVEDEIKPSNFRILFLKYMFPAQKEGIDNYKDFVTWMKQKDFAEETIIFMLNH